MSCVILERHRLHLKESIHHLISCSHHLKQHDMILATQDLRQAIQELDRIIGTTTHIEHLLDLIFRDFCIGK
jgi:tRNA U34 5-carboxymethylaminomethyl modifying GTPase MnmE/TrmE